MRTSKVKHAVLIALALLPALAALGQTPYYVDASRPDDSGDGLSWGAAKKTIQAAVSLANDGDTVWVRAGTYSVPAQAPILINKGITIRSELGGLAGAEVTIVEGPGTSATLISRVFTLNHADAELSGLTISQGRITSGSEHGAGIHMTGGLVTHCIITNNTTSIHNFGGSGVGVYMIGGAMSNCTIIGNAALGNTVRGGGVFMTNGAFVSHCTIAYNTFGNAYACFGAGAYMAGGSMLRNCLVYGNNALSAPGGGVYGGTVESCTIVGNSAGLGGGVNAATVINSIVTGNTGSSRPADNYSGGSFSYSCTSPLPSGAGNTDADPEFVNEAGWDYRLEPGSPCVDTGSNQAWMSGDRDLDGNARIYNATVDMGAYEQTPGPLRCHLMALPSLSIAPVDVVLTANVTGTNMSGLYYWWDFNNDGTIDLQGAGRQVVTNLYYPGIYDVSVTVSNAAAEVSSSTRFSYLTLPASNIYVRPSGAPVAPYTNWAEAAASLHDALSVAADGVRIVVTDGVYEVTGQLYMNRPMTLESVNGATATVARLVGGSGRVMNLDHAGVVVNGFTITDGTNVSGAGVYMTGGLVRDCVITNNSISAHSVVGGGIYMSGGVVSNCVVVNNRTAGNSGWGGGIYCDGGQVTRCTIEKNMATAGYQGDGGGIYMANLSACVLHNCLIADNFAQGVGGGVYAAGANSQIESCTIAGNSANTAGGSYRATLKNSIVFGNTATDPNPHNYNLSVFTYSCSTPLPAGAGNIEDDPLFVDAAAGDYRLEQKSGVSPCIDTGTNQAWMVAASDLDGNPRMIRGTKPSSGPVIVDMGCYEAPSPLVRRIVFKMR